jgi:hypothetical protein
MIHAKECKLRLENLIKEHTGEDINQKTRRREIVHLRSVAYKIMAKEQCLPSHIATVFGITHATVLHHLKDFEFLYEFDKNFRMRYDSIERFYFGFKDQDEGKGDNSLYDVVDRIPVTERDNVRVRLEAMIAGFNIRPKGYQGKVYQSNLTTIE